MLCQRGGDPRVLGGSQQSQHPRGVVHGLAPGQGNAPHFSVEGLVPQNNPQDLLHRHIPLGRLQGLGAAHVGASAAGYTLGAVKYPLGMKTVSPRRAGRYAGAAIDASGLVKQDLLPSPLRLGVVTPRAPQGTPLEKHHRPHPGTVAHTKALDLGYRQGYGFTV